MKNKYSVKREEEKVENLRRRRKTRGRKRGGAHPEEPELQL